MNGYQQSPPGFPAQQSLSGSALGPSWASVPPPPPMPPFPAPPQPTASFPQATFPGQSMPGPAPVQPPMMPLPSSLHMPSEAAIQQAYAAAAAEQERIARRSSGNSSGMKFFSPPGPDSTFKWGPSVPVGFVSRAVVWLCPPGDASQMPFLKTTSHFWKSARSPQGDTLPCLGAENCPLCVSRNTLFRTGTTQDAEYARSVGRARTNYVYNVLWLENPQSHMESGKMVPHLWRAGAKTQDDLMSIAQTLGWANIVNPQNGRPIKITKTKKGPQEMDVDYSIMNLDAAQLPPQFNAALYNLWDPAKLAKAPIADEYANAVREMKLPFTADVQNLISRLPAASTGAPQQQATQYQYPAPPQNQSFAPQAPSHPQNPPLEVLQRQLGGGR